MIVLRAIRSETPASYAIERIYYSHRRTRREYLCAELQRELVGSARWRFEVVNHGGINLVRGEEGEEPPGRVEPVGPASRAAAVLGVQVGWVDRGHILLGVLLARQDELT